MSRRQIRALRMPAGIIFGAALCGVFQAGSMAAGNSQQRMTLHFPKSHSAGTLFFVKDDGELLKYQDRFRHNGITAQGDVEVPVHQQLAFYLSYSGAQDASYLDAMPNANMILINARNVECVNDDTVKHIAQIKPLRYLQLERDDVTDACLRYLGQLPHLRSLGMAGTLMKGDGLVYLSHLPELSDLQLSRTELNENKLAALENMKSLEDLAVSASSVSDKSCEHLAHIPNLRFVDLSRNLKVTNAGVAKLAALSKLQVLNIEGTSATEFCANSLAKMPKLMSVRFAAKDVSKEGLTRLHKALPRVAVSLFPMAGIDQQLFAPLH